jgi:hypothetical protein
MFVSSDVNVTYKHEGKHFRAIQKLHFRIREYDGKGWLIADGNMKRAAQGSIFWLIMSSQIMPVTTVFVEGQLLPLKQREITDCLLLL